MKKALIIGIDKYPETSLNSSVAHAKSIGDLLSSNYDLSPNFDVKLLVSDNGFSISQKLILEEITTLLDGESDQCFLYFSGLGMLSHTEDDIELLGQEGLNKTGGLNLNVVIELANQSLAREVILIFDTIGTEGYGNRRITDKITSMREGVAILAGMTSKDLYNQMIISESLSLSLSGFASDLLGKVSIISVFEFLNKMLGPWQQKVFFKSHLSKAMPLRLTKPSIDPELVRELFNLFPEPDYEFELNPSFEPNAGHGKVENEKRFRILQKFRAVNLIQPVGEEHMYYAALNSKSCVLTPLGKFYWKLVNDKRI